MRKNCIMLFLLFILISPLCANNDTSLYINGLESIIQKDTSQAKESFNTLIEDYPNSEFNFKASNLLSQLNQKVENSGIVPFYLGNLATLSYSSYRLLDLLEIDQNPLSIGISGLSGVGLGISSSYLLSKNFPISSELYWRIITNQIVSMGNFFYLQGITYGFDLFNNYQTQEKFLLSSQLATLNGSLFLSYFGLRNKELQKGKGFFSLQSYAWANYYYWLSTIFFDSPSSTNKLLLGMALTDLAYFSSFSVWDKLEWSSTRSGLVSVGGIGGALIGFFTNLILEEYISLNEKTVASFVMGTSLAGKILVTYLTRNLDNEENKQIASKETITAYPIFTANNEIGVGFHCFI